MELVINWMRTVDDLFLRLVDLRKRIIMSSSNSPIFFASSSFIYEVKLIRNSNVLSTTDMNSPTLIKKV